MKKTSVLLMFVALTTVSMNAQNDTKHYQRTNTNVNTSVVNQNVGTPNGVVDVLPEYPGGRDALMKYFSENIRYPISALENNVQGVVVCKFVVNASGDISEISVVKSLDPECDKEAMRAILNMDRWNPALKDGKPVSCFYNLPVRFVIPESQPEQKKEIRDTKDLRR